MRSHNSEAKGTSVPRMESCHICRVNCFQIDMVGELNHMDTLQETDSRKGETKPPVHFEKHQNGIA